MPEGFEQNATTDDVNDLWAFFRTLHAPPKHLEGNVPAIVEIPAEGNVALLASQAEIYGGDITFELPFQNIGYWHHRDDMVRWRITSPAIREVHVWAEWACDLTRRAVPFRSRAVSRCSMAMSDQPAAGIAINWGMSAVHGS